MFRILVILLLAALCFIIYVYSSNQIGQLKKQVRLLINENNELRIKLKNQYKEHLKEVTNEEKPNNET